MRCAHIPFSLPRQLTQQIKFASPNIHELRSIAIALDYPADSPPFWDDHQLLDPTIDQSNLLQTIKQVATFVSDHIDNVIVTLGPLGVLIANRCPNPERRYYGPSVAYSTARGETVSARFYAARKFNRIVNVSGAGDSFTSGFIASMIRGNAEGVCVSVGFEAAGSALMSRGAVPDRYFDVQHSCWKSSASYDLI